MKVGWEGGIEAAFDYGINPDELHNPVVAEAWRAAYAADEVYNTAYEAAKTAVRASQ